MSRKWGQETFTHLTRISHSAESNEAGCHLLGGYKVFNYKPKDLQVKYWAFLSL